MCVNVRLAMSDVQCASESSAQTQQLGVRAKTIDRCRSPRLTRDRASISRPLSSFKPTLTPTIESHLSLPVAMATQRNITQHYTILHNFTQYYTTSWPTQIDALFSLLASRLVARFRGHKFGAAKWLELSVSDLAAWQPAIKLPRQARCCN